jgi:DNA-binding NarL/FixJ family response regulator
MTSPQTPLRIIVADDQASVRECFSWDFCPTSRWPPRPATATRRSIYAPDTNPDAILLDLHMPGVDGIEATRQLTQHYPGVAIVVLTTYSDDTSVLLRSGPGLARRIVPSV